jgi:hypothetical protein
MGKKEKEEEEEVEWKPYWKNIDGLGMILRVLSGIAIIMWANSNKENPKAKVAATYGVSMIIDGLVRWCPMRAIFRHPTKRAYRRHYPEEA